MSAVRSPGRHRRRPHEVSAGRTEGARNSASLVQAALQAVPETAGPPCAFAHRLFLPFRRRDPERPAPKPASRLEFESWNSNASESTRMADAVVLPPREVTDRVTVVCHESRVPLSRVAKAGRHLRVRTMRRELAPSTPGHWGLPHAPRPRASRKSRQAGHFPQPGACYPSREHSTPPGACHPSRAQCACSGAHKLAPEHAHVPARRTQCTLACVAPPSPGRASGCWRLLRDQWLILGEG